MRLKQYEMTPIKDGAFVTRVNSKAKHMRHG